MTVTVFDDQAAWIKGNVSKGQPVLAEGRINNSSYEKDGETVYTTDGGDDVQRIPGQH